MDKDTDTELSVENLNELFSSKDSEKLKEAYLNLKEGNEKASKEYNKKPF